MNSLKKVILFFGLSFLGFGKLNAQGLGIEVTNYGYPSGGAFDFSGINSLFNGNPNVGVMGFDLIENPKNNNIKKIYENKDGKSPFKNCEDKYGCRYVMNGDEGKVVQQEKETAARERAEQIAGYKRDEDRLRQVVAGAATVKSVKDVDERFKGIYREKSQKAAAGILSENSQTFAKEKQLKAENIQIKKVEIPKRDTILNDQKLDTENDIKSGNKNLDDTAAELNDPMEATSATAEVLAKEKAKMDNKRDAAIACEAGSKSLSGNAKCGDVPDINNIGYVNSQPSRNVLTALEYAGRAARLNGDLSGANRYQDFASSYKNFESGNVMPYQNTTLSSSANEFFKPDIELQPNNFFSYETIRVMNGIMDKTAIFSDEEIRTAARLIGENLVDAIPFSQSMRILKNLELGWGIVDIINAQIDGATDAVADAATFGGNLLFQRDKMNMMLLMAVYEHRKTWESFKDLVAKNYDILKNCNSDPLPCAELSGYVGADIVMALIPTGPPASKAFQEAAEIAAKVRVLNAAGEALSTASFEAFKEINETVRKKLKCGEICAVESEQIVHRVIQESAKNGLSKVDDIVELAEAMPSLEKLPLRNYEHVQKGHNFELYSKQIAHQPIKDIELKLVRDTFFNKDWSVEK
ncbi:MAG: hypothetical protein EOP04_15135, partial [Proteobacteria bacterium]